ncbi:MAG: hypothetical protein RR840_05555 [Clostridium sp.]
MEVIFGIIVVAIIIIGVTNLVKSTKNGKYSGDKASKSSFVLSEQQRQSMSHLHDQHARVIEDDCNHPGCESHDHVGGCDSGSSDCGSGSCD